MPSRFAPTNSSHAGAALPCGSRCPPAALFFSVHTSASIPDFLALTGDDADGIPGLAGIGERTAAALLGAYGHIEQIPDDPAAWSVAVRGADRIARALIEQREDALLYRTLATLRTDVPLAEGLDDLRFRGVPRDRFEAWCDAMDVRTLKARPTRWV